MNLDFTTLLVTLPVRLIDRETEKQSKIHADRFHTHFPTRGFAIIDASWFFIIVDQKGRVITGNRVILLVYAETDMSIRVQRVHVDHHGG